MATTTTTSAARVVANFLASGDQKLVLDLGDSAVSIERDGGSLVVETTKILGPDSRVADLLAALGLAPTTPVEDRR